MRPSFRLYMLFLAITKVACATDVPKELPPGASSPVGYATVAAALADLRLRSDVDITVRAVGPSSVTVATVLFGHLRLRVTRLIPQL
jgi:hypothetical protein